MCPSEKALEVHASVERSESFALGKRFAVPKLTANLSQRAKLRPRLLVTSGRLFRHPRSKSAPAKNSRFLAAEPAWKQANCRLSHPFLIIRKIGCPFPHSLRRRKASLTVDRLQQGEPSLFGSSSAECQCFALGKRFAVATLTASLSPRAIIRPRLLITSGCLFRHPRSKSAPAKIS